MRTLRSSYLTWRTSVTGSEHFRLHDVLIYHAELVEESAKA